MRLTATDQILEFVTSATANVEYVIDYVDMATTAGAVTNAQPESVHGVISSAATTTVLAAPASNEVRDVSEIAIRNVHASASNTVTVQKDIAATNRRVVQFTLAAGESAIYVKGRGWAVINSAGRELSADTSPTSEALTLARVSMRV